MPSKRWSTRGVDGKMYSFERKNGVTRRVSSVRRAPRKSGTRRSGRRGMYDAVGFGYNAVEWPGRQMGQGEIGLSPIIRDHPKIRAVWYNRASMRKLIASMIAKGKATDDQRISDHITSALKKMGMLGDLSTEFWGHPTSNHERVALLKAHGYTQPEMDAIFKGRSLLQSYLSTPASSD